MCHVYKIVRCPIGEACQGEAMQDEHFGMKINAVDRRARRLMGVFSIEGGEPHLQHHFFPTGNSWSYMHGTTHHNVREHWGNSTKNVRKAGGSTRQKTVRLPRNRQGLSLEGVYFRSSGR